MKTRPITAGRLSFTPEGLPLSLDPAGHACHACHPTAGALVQARHVFLAGNRLPDRWAARERFVILETGFGAGNDFLAAWDAWRADPQRCAQLIFVSIEKHPLAREDLARAHASCALPELATQLCAAWPLRTPNFHPLAFEDGRVQLLLGFGDIGLLLPQLVASVDAFFIEGLRSAGNPALRNTHLLRRLGRLAAPGATAASPDTSSVLQEGLIGAGFAVEAVAGVGEVRGMTVARHSPRHVALPPPGGWHRHRGAREAIVIGAGLAGCAAAWALSLQGWKCRVLDREGEVACATSGNPAGLFHGSFHREDGPHARVHRAAALLTQRVAGPWITERQVSGQLAGCLRLESRLEAASALAALAAQQLDTGYVGWLDRDAASRLCGLNLPSGAWHYPGGGWLAPRAYARQLLGRSGAAFIGNVRVARIARRGGAWQALNGQDDVLAEAPVLVLANALDARRLLGTADSASSGSGGTENAFSAASARWDSDSGHRRLPDGAEDRRARSSQEAFAALSAVRGQISSFDVSHMPRLALPRLPVAGSGYVLPPIDGRLTFGATSRADDGDPQLRESDHRSNLAQLAGLCAGDAKAWQALPWEGRVGWRTATPDRLPLIGAAVDFETLHDAVRIDQPGFVPRLRDSEGGLYLFTGLGSRGIAWAALGGQLLASWVSGAPCPLEADLRSSLDPARCALGGSIDRFANR